MREQPVVFSGPMVRAMIEGRKTVTRRIVKPQPSTTHWQLIPGYAGDYRQVGEDLWRFAHRIPQNPEWDCDSIIRCPYGQTGDRLWVKERWRPFVAYSHGAGECDCGDVNVEYRADGEVRFFRDGSIPFEWTMPKAAARGDVTPLFMPRWASRITLEMTAVRVERLQDGEGELDLESRYLAEGINRIHHGDGAYYYSALRDEPHPKNWNDPFDAWRELWQSTGGDWDANPWVWVIEFKRIEQERKEA